MARIARHGGNVQDLIGRKLGPYEIRDVIGHGGMAIVYRAYQPALNRFVAIKVLNTVMAQDTEFVARFRQEALAAGGLDHPNILRIYDADAFEGRQYIVMAYAPGGTLTQRLRKGGAMPYDEAADTVSHIADALHYAHRRGIVHRDIKPSNILLDEEGRPLLADFGVAQAVSSGPRLTQTGSSIGTPDYMSPEQAEGQRVDGRSDLFSLGIVLYQMATGKMPFQADTSMAIMFQVVHQTPAPPRAVNPAIPGYLDSIIQKALAKQPDARFQTGQEMAQALRERRVVAVPPPSEAWDQASDARCAWPAASVRAAVRRLAGQAVCRPWSSDRAPGAGVGGDPWRRVPGVGYAERAHSPRRRPRGADPIGPGAAHRATHRPPHRGGAAIAHARRGRSDRGQDRRAH
jgi:serine/threonine protein kinase